MHLVNFILDLYRNKNQQPRSRRKNNVVRIHYGVNVGLKLLLLLLLL